MNNKADDTTITQSLQQLTTMAAPPAYHNFAEWKQAFQALCASKANPWEQALFGGAQAGCVGYAFAAGYQAALHSLLGQHSSETISKTISETISKNSNVISALCVTESGGNHPRAIQTTLTQTTSKKSAEDLYLLDGSKTFITGGPQADVLLVAATTGEDSQGRPVLRLVKVPGTAEGVSVQPMPPLPFVPEIDHASVSFAKVRVPAEDILPGDGYADYVKPFRTTEDIHVTLALCGYLVRMALQTGYAPEQLPLWLSLTAQHIQLAQLPAADPMTHLLLAGVRGQLEQAIPDLESHWQHADPESFAHWQRDKALLKVASKAREQRTATALKNLPLP